MVLRTTAQPRILPVAVITALLLGLAGCAPAANSASTDSSPSATASSQTAAASVQIVDAWIKAVDEGMTGGFAVLENAGTDPITLVGAATDVAATVELHEMVMRDGAMVMQAKEGGIEIAAEGTHELAPGADHIMLLGVVQALQPGDEVVVTLQFSDGSTLQHPFTVKEFSGADEEYVGDPAGGDHSNG